MSATNVDRVLGVVKRVCAAERGRKAELARACEVRPSQISEWFSRRSDPSLESGLLMLAWLRGVDEDAWRMCWVQRRA